MHLRYFFHLGRGEAGWAVRMAGVLAVVLIIFMVGGTLWILFNLNGRMMP